MANGQMANQEGGTHLPLVHAAREPVPLRGAEGDRGALAGASGSVGGRAVGAGDGSEDGRGAAAAFDGVFGGLHRFAENLKGFVGELVVVGAAVEGAEGEKGFVGRGDFGLLEPEGEVGEGEGVGLGVGADGGGGDEGFEEGRRGRRDGQIAKGPKGQIRTRGLGGRDGETKRRRDGVVGRGEGVGEGALTPALSRRGRARGQKGGGGGGGGGEGALTLALWRRALLRGGVERGQGRAGVVGRGGEQRAAERLDEGPHGA